MMKKFKFIVTGIAFTGILSFGANTFFETLQAGEADLPSPQRPSLTYTHGDHFITKSTYTNKGDLPISVQGDHGGSPSYAYGDYPAPQA